MRHGILAFKNMERAVDASARLGGTVTGWDGVKGLMLERLMGGVEGGGGNQYKKDRYSGYLDIHLEALDGHHFTLDEILRRGRPILLVFFATWCPTCSRNISALSKAYQQHRESVEVVLASFDPSETAGEIEDFLGRVSAHQDWIVSKPSIQLLLSLRVVSQETVFLISREGEIIYEKRFGILTEEEWSQILLIHH
jgi:thiol-disulfide isomerase/thioredoxin